MRRITGDDDRQWRLIDVEALELSKQQLSLEEITKL
jgi:hypothetical protein